MQPRIRWIYSSRLHLVMYSMLLVATPFIFLQSFLVEKIGEISATRAPVGPYSIPLMPVIGLIAVVVLIFWLRRLITKYLIAAIGVVVLMNAAAQQITDYYFDHRFYDLQQNWHYIAYALFAYMMYRDLEPRGKSLARIMWLTFVSAMLFSTFDETFQKHMSSRVFDVSDIAKDTWGVLMGMVLVYLGGPRAGEMLKSGRSIRHRRIGEYFRHPLSSLILMVVLTFILLCNASLLSDFEYWPMVLLLSAAGIVAVFMAFHFSQYKKAMIAMSTAAALVVVAQGWAFLKYKSEGVVHNSYGLTVYRGVPIPFYDVLIFPDDGFRLVDKKHYFNSRDQAFFLRHEPDILLIGSGSQGLGGRGFHGTAPNQFIYNRYTRKGVQVIILPSPDACRVFNRLKREGKNVLFVLHNTC